MAKGKATVLLDRQKVDEARRLVGGRSMSEVIEIALDRLIRVERLRRDVAAYAKLPPTDEELAFSDLPAALDLDDEDVDYEAPYGQDG